MTRRATRMRFGPATAGMAALLLLATCAEPPDSDYTQRHPLSAAPETVNIPAYYSGGVDPFAGSEGKERFTALVQGYLNVGHGPLTISSGGTSVVASSLAATRVEALRRRFVDAGVKPDDIRTALAAQGTPDIVTVTYERYVAILPVCGDWSTSLDFTPDNQQYPDMGCAQQHNLGAMVQDPADLVGMRPPAAARAIDLERAEQLAAPTPVTSGYSGAQSASSSGSSSSSSSGSTSSMTSTR